MKSAVSEIRSSSSTSTGELLASLLRDQRHNNLVESLCRGAFAIRNYHVADHLASVLTYSRTGQVQFRRPAGGHLPSTAQQGQVLPRSSRLQHVCSQLCWFTKFSRKSANGPMINRELCKEELSQSPANVGGFNLV